MPTTPWTNLHRPGDQADLALKQDPDAGAQKARALEGPVPGTMVEGLVEEGDRLAGLHDQAATAARLCSLPSMVVRTTCGCASSPTSSPVNEVAFLREGRQFREAVPDELVFTLEVELTW